MQLVNCVVAALALTFLPLFALAEDHLQARGQGHHQAIARRAEGHVLDPRAVSNSKWSWYHTETGQAGSCGRFLRNSQYVVAMNAGQYRGSDCFKSITLSWRGKTARAQIVDMCPGCPRGGLDLSPSLFQHFTGLGTGIIWDGVWWFDGDGPEQPRPTTTRRTTTTSRWVAPSTTRTSTRSRTSTRRTSSTTTSTSATESATPPALAPAQTLGNLGSILQLAVSIADLAVDAADVDAEA